MARGDGRVGRRKTIPGRERGTVGRPAVEHCGDKEQEEAGAPGQNESDKLFFVIKPKN